MSLGQSIYLLVSQLLMSTFWGFFSSFFLLVLKSFSYKSIYNWKFVHRHPRHLGFCWQNRRIWLRYKTRIRNFWYLFSYIFCFFFFFFFFFGYCFIWMESSQPLLNSYTEVSEKRTCTKLTPWVHCTPDFQTWISGGHSHAEGKIK